MSIRHYEKITYSMGLVESQYVPLSDFLTVSGLEIPYFEL